MSVKLALSLERGDPATVRRLMMGSHTGTHVDAPAHFLPDGATVDDLDPAVWVGPCRVVAIDHPVAITVADLARQDWAGVTRVLFRTRNSWARWDQAPFRRDYIYLEPDAAGFLVDLGLRLVGIDYLSIDGFHQADVPTHRVLLSRQIAIVEGLVLTDIAVGDYDLCAVPLCIAQGDGAPARVLIRPR